MPLIKRAELPAQLAELQNSDPPQVICCLGERYLAREAADLLQQAILARTPGTVHSIDGDIEDPARTLARLTSFSLLPGRQIFRIGDSRIFHSKTSTESIWTRALQAQEGGRPEAALRSLLALLEMAGCDRETETPFTGLSSGQWQDLFGFPRPAGDLDWADSLVAGALLQTAASGKETGIAERYISAIEKGLPPAHVVILTVEEADRRMKLFAAIKKHGLVVDCAVAAGSGAAAQSEQKDILRQLAQKTLAGFGKKIETSALDLFFERVGFHPVAVVMESEKLAFFVGERQTVTGADIEQMVARNREDALYELTDAFGKRQTGRTMTILNRLQDSGTHGLAILATMRNYLRRLLLIRSFQSRPNPRWHSGMNARQFQNDYLPVLKESGEWPELFKGHPYALFMSFTTAAGFSGATLRNWLGLLLAAEYRLKGSPLPPRLVLEDLFLTMLGGSTGG
jgi:DNA polymerase-3 subunit delta